MYATHKMTVAYDGTDYHGWQVQPRDVTVCSTLLGRFEKVFGSAASILAASRTDAGVHALGQVARVRIPTSLHCPRLLDAWNNALPSGILIRDLETVGASYSPFSDVKRKTYYYHLFYKRPLPIVARFGWQYEFIDRVDLATFERGLQLYKGEHEFGSFCKQEGDEVTVRTVDAIRLIRLPQFGALRVVVQGKGFVRFQIRRMIGYALDVARRSDMNLQDLKRILDNPDPQQSLLKADASGLMLRKIEYKPSTCVLGY